MSIFCLPKCQTGVFFCESEVWIGNCVKDPEEWVPGIVKSRESRPLGWDDSAQWNAQHGVGPKESEKNPKHSEILGYPLRSLNPEIGEFSAVWQSPFLLTKVSTVVGGNSSILLEFSPLKMEKMIQFDDLRIFFKWVGGSTTNYLEPKFYLYFWRSTNPPKQDRNSNQNKGPHLGSR